MITLRLTLAALLLAIFPGFAAGAEGPEPVAVRVASAPPQWSEDYDTAFGYALAGDADKAFHYLQLSVNGGFFNTSHLLEDPDLNSLHADARWAPLVARVKDKAAFEARLFNSPALVSLFRENISEDEKIAGLSKMWSEIKYNLVDADALKRTDWDKLYFAYLPKVRATASTAAYYEVLVELCAKLNSSGTEIVRPFEVNYAALSWQPFSTRPIEGRVIVDAVIDPALRDKGVVPGVEVVSVDGVAAATYARNFAKSAQLFNGDSDHVFEAQALGKYFLAGSAFAVRQVRFERADGTQFALPIRRLAQDAERLTQPFTSTMSMLPGEVAYFQLRGNFPETAAHAMRQLALLPTAKALIIDVRRYRFSTSEGAVALIQALAARPFQLVQSTSRAQRAVDRGRDVESAPVLDGGENIFPEQSGRFHKPVLILTSALTHSSVERMVATLANMRRVVLVGERTAGGSWSSLLVELPGGGFLNVSTSRGVPQGRLEATGVNPDVHIVQTVADFRKGSDTVLNAALAAAHALTQ